MLLPSFLAAPKSCSRVSRSHVSTRLDPNSPNFSSWQRYSFSLISFVALFWTRSNSSMSFLCWGPQSLVQCYKWALTRAEQRGRVLSLTLLLLLLVQPRIQLLVFWAGSACCWLISIFPSNSTHKSLSLECFCGPGLERV